MWNNYKITPLNSSIGYTHSGKFWKRKLGGLVIKYILRTTHNNIIVNARYYENAFSLNFCTKHLKNSATIIDIGSSESEFPLLLHASGFKVTAFDQRNYPFTESIKGDAGKLSSYFSTQNFDCISAISTIEHIGLGDYGDSLFNTSYLDLINEWKKVLKSNGFLIITTPVTSSEKRHEKGQWVENIMNFKKIIEKSSGSIIEEQLVVQNENLTCKWELLNPNIKKDFELGVYMVGLKY